MNDEAYAAYCEGVRLLLADHLRVRYGRDSEYQHPLTPYEAGIRTRTFFNLPEVLADANTSFQTETLNARLDVLMQDLLLHPDDAPTAEWAHRYGYRSAGAAGRAFRARYGVGVGQARRVGRLARWLTGERRASSVRGRHSEAREVIRGFSADVRPRILPLGAAALAGLQSPENFDPGLARPRYPRAARAGRAS